MASMALSGGPEDSRQGRLWRLLQSGYLFGGGFALAAGLTAVAVFLAASPPARGPVDDLIGGLFSLLSLVLPREQLRVAYHGLRSGDQRLKGTALEYLERVLPNGVRQRLWPLLVTAESITPASPILEPGHAEGA